DYTKVESLWVKHNGSIVQNNVRCLQTDLDKFAFPARDIYYQFPEPRNSRMRVAVTARGCPYACTYCYNYKIKELYKQYPVSHLRHRSVGNVIEEIIGIRDNYRIEYIYFGTDCFTTKKDWVLEFSEKYRKQVGIPFLASTRPETANPEVCQALKAANCIAMYMGIESGNDEIRRTLLNRKMTDERIIAASRYIHEAGLHLATFNMMLLPGETIDQALDTMRINQKCKTNYTWVAIFQPFPRTKLADYAIEKGYFDGDYDSLPFSWYRHSVLKNPQRIPLERLHKLTSIGVEFPWLTPFIKILIHLPFKPVYHFIMKVHKAYAYRFRIMPLKLSFKEVVKIAWKYLFDKSE
ncbi:MAG: radical SAM protein, partial [FCB group bacterium]|nr:radical SAM protein [FCB group bacterium]